MPCIYGFYDLSGSLLYIGSSEKDFWLRFMSHIHSYYYPEDRGAKMNIIKKIKELGGFDYITHKVLFSCEQIEKKLLRKYEREFIERLNPSCNTSCPIRFEGENNKIKIQKEAENKERTLCECGVEYYKKNKRKHIKTKKHLDFIS
jgi:hypothetical protein